MAKRPGIRKTIEQLLNRVETLENQNFGQKLAIDELESKLASAEESLKQVKENPFGLGLPQVNIPYVQTPAPPQIPQPQWIPPSPLYPMHVCTPGPSDWTGGTFCTSCGAHMLGPTWTVTTTSDGTSFTLANPAEQSSSDVEPVLDMEISWIIPDDFPKKD